MSLFRVNQRPMTPHAMPRISTLAAAKQLGTNTSKAMGGITHNLMLNPKLLRRNSLIFSTLILVLSRIGIAFQTAQKAKGTEEESYRFKEAVKTTIREAGGWTLTYGFFRGVEYITRLGLRRWFGIEKQDLGLGLDDLKKEFGYAVRREKSPFKGVKHIEKLDNYQFNYAQQARYDKIDPYVERFITRARKFFKKGVEHFPNESLRKLHRLRGIYNLLPVIAATIPTVILSGVLLERYTRDNADRLAENMTHKWRVGFDGAKPAEQTRNSIAFNAYFNRILELQGGRMPQQQLPPQQQQQLPPQ